MRKIYSVLAVFLLAVLLVSACSPAASQVSDTSNTPSSEGVNQNDVVENSSEPVEENVAESGNDLSESVSEEEPSVLVAPEDFSWDQEYITEIAPIMMVDPYFQIFGQSDGAVPYTYETAVKLAGHSCGATAGAWTITRKALEFLYPNGETPVRGQIAVEAPGAEDEWYVGVFGDVITYITGASPKTGFIGAEFGQTDNVFVRQNKMVYPEDPTGTMPPQMEWIFTRLDNDTKVGIIFNLAVITPIATDEYKALGAKMAAGEANPDETADYYQYWNDRAKFVFENADALDGFFLVNVYQEAPLTTGEAVVASVPTLPEAFAWGQEYITAVEPIMMLEPYFQIFGQSQTAVPYYYEEVVKLAGHSCGATTGAWIITQKALEVLYPDGEIPVRGQIAVEAPGAEDEWFVGVFGEIITYITGAAPHTGFVGAEFGQTDDVFVRQNKMVYAEEPTGQLPPMREWIFTRLDTGQRVGVKFNLVVITPLPTPGRVAMGKTMAAGEATPEEAADYIEYWNARAQFVLDKQDMNGFFTVTKYP
ncbi:hypothetical protein KQH40_00395 [bacterium]|nr:hypothetical protein [bacterium]